MTEGTWICLLVGILVFIAYRVGYDMGREDEYEDQRLEKLKQMMRGKEKDGDEN